VWLKNNDSTEAEAVSEAKLAAYSNSDAAASATAVFSAKSASQKPQMAAPTLSGAAAPGTPVVPPPPSASLYVGDLNKDVREEHLFEIFSVVGPIDSIRVLRDHVSRVSLGYAYVNFSSAQDAERAVDTLNYYVIKGRPLRIMWKQRDPSLRKSGAGNIFIKNIDASVTSRDLLDTFSQFGNILSCKVATSEDGKSKGFGFVIYESLEEAEKAVKYTNGQKLTPTQSLALVVAHYVPAEKRPVGRSFTNVLVKNIREDVTDEQLAAAFASCGKIMSAVVHRDPNGKSKRHGFVNFELPEAAVKCIEQFNDSESLAMPGDRIQVLQHLKRSEYHRQRALAAMGGADKAPFQGTNLYVKYLDDNVTDEKLRDMFAGCGQVVSANVEMDKEKGISKGFGYVNFSTSEEATKAVTEMNGKTVGTKPLYVCLHMSREQRLQFVQSQGMRQNNFRQPMYNPGMMPFFPGMMGQMPYGQQFPQNRMMNTMARPVSRNMMGMNQGPGGPRNPAFMAPGYMAVRPPRVTGGYAAVPPAAVFKQQARNVPSAAPGAPVAVAPAPNKNDLAAMLAQATPEQQKQMLGERLYMLIVPTQSQLAGKITGMLLDGLDTAELLSLVDSPLALDEKIKMALDALQKHAKP
jgi:polyadenylate-binding protein